jgi:hypothetical protein
MGLLERIFAPRQIKALERAFKAIRQLGSGGGVSKTISLIMVTVELFGAAFFDLPQTPRGQSLNLDGYALVFEDEFEGTELDLSKWAYRASGARRSGFNSQSQVRVEGGNLIITGEYLTDGEYGEGWYAGMIRNNRGINKRIILKSGAFAQRGRILERIWLNSTGMASEEQSNGGIGGAEDRYF